MKNMFNVTTVLPHNLLQTNPCIRHNFSTQVFRKPPREARKCSAAQGPHREVVPRDFWRLVSKSCDEWKGLFARGCEAKRWSHWTCSSLGTIFQPIRINSVPDVKSFCNNINVLRAQLMVWHLVRQPVGPQLNKKLPEFYVTRMFLTLIIYIFQFYSYMHINCTKL